MGSGLLSLLRFLSDSVAGGRLGAARSFLIVEGLSASDELITWEFRFFVLISLWGLDFCFDFCFDWGLDFFWHGRCRCGFGSPRGACLSVRLWRWSFPGFMVCATLVCLVVCSTRFSVRFWRWPFFDMFACGALIVWSPAVLAFSCLVAYGVGLSLSGCLRRWPFLELILVY